MKVGEVVQRVQSLSSKGVESRSSRLSRRHIYSKMLSVRSLLFYNKINKKQFLSKYNYTFLPCVELEEVPENECPCIVPGGCTILRTKYKLPKPINSLNGYIIDSVTSVDGRTIFDEVTYLRKVWRKGDKYSSDKPDYFIKGDYLYVTSTRKLKAVSIMGLFSNPIEANSYPSACVDEKQECPIFPMDMEFTLDNELIDALVELTVQELSVGFMFGDEDRRNDSNDKIEVAQSPRQSRQRRQQQQRRRDE